MAPENWKEKILSEIAKVERGRFSARPRNDSQYYGGKIPFIQTGNITASNGYIKNYSQTLNNKGLKVSKKFPKGTILITIAANIGDTAIATFEVACPDSIVGITPLKNINGIWLSYYLKTRKNYLESQATQNAQKNINLQTLKPLRLSVPPLSEQKKIAEILSTWDRAIELTEKLIEAKEKKKRGLMQQLLTGKKRFSGFKGQWAKHKLKEFGTFSKGKGISKSETLERGLPCVRYGEIYTIHNYVINEFKSFISEYTCKSSLKLKRGDIIFACSGEKREDIGKSVAFVKDIESYVGGDTIIFSPKANDSIFLSYILNSTIGRRQLYRVSQGYSVVHVSKKKY